MAVEIIITRAPYPIRVLDFPLIPGKAWVKRFEFMNPDAVTPLNLTGFSGRGKISVEDSESAVSIADITGTLDDDPALGGITFDLSTIDSANLIGKGKIVYFWLYRTPPTLPEILIFAGVFNLDT